MGWRTMCSLSGPGKRQVARGTQTPPLRFCIGGSKFQSEATEAWAIGIVEVVSEFIRVLSFRYKDWLIIFLHPNLIDQFWK
jgi:hypothetical protein